MEQGVRDCATHLIHLLIKRAKRARQFTEAQVELGCRACDRIASHRDRDTTPDRSQKPRLHAGMPSRGYEYYRPLQPTPVDIEGVSTEIFFSILSDSSGAKILVYTVFPLAQALCQIFFDVEALSNASLALASAEWVTGARYEPADRRASPRHDRDGHDRKHKGRGEKNINHLKDSLGISGHGERSRLHLIFKFVGTENCFNCVVWPILVVPLF